jgi:N-acetylglucosaminyl-diphospho-decaprenol L-rhamnosyltransferase
VLAVVVLTFRRPAAELRTCVQSVLDGGGCDLLIVVDNGQAAAASLAEIVGRRDVVLHRTGDNLGYAGGMNEGIRLALDRGATHVALLNDDVVVSVGWLAPLVAALAADASLGAVQPMLVHGERVNSLGVAVGPDGAGTDLGRDEPVDRERPAVLPIEGFTGGAVLLRRQFVADVGLFDERYFLYYEDVDLAARGTRRGWRFACVTTSRVHHEGSATTAELGDLQRYYQERNRLRATMTYGSWSQVGSAWWLSVRRLRHPPRATHLRAVVSALVVTPSSLLDRRRHRA